MNDLFYHTFFDLAPDPMAITDFDNGRIIDVNKAFAAWSGYSRDELIGHTTTELGFWFDDESRKTVLRELKEAGFFTDIEIELRRKGDETRQIVFSGRLIEMDGKKWFLSVARDISGQKKSEEELRKNRRFLSDLIEHSGALICVKDREGRYEMVNHKWEEVTGLDRLDTISRTDEELFPGPIGEQFRRNDLEVMVSGLALEKEEVLQDGQGKRSFISIKFPLRGDEGQVSGICGMITEITARKAVEKELAVSRDRLSRAEIISRSGNWEFDLNSKHVFASVGAREIYGLRESEWTISDVQKIPLPEYRDMLDTALMGLIKEKRPYDVEFKIRRPATGEIVDIHSVAEYDHQRNVVFGIIQDITEYKRAEFQLKAALEALGKSESLMRAITDSAQDAILMMDTGGAISFWNPAAEHIFGYTRDEAIGRNLHQFLAPERFLESYNAVFDEFQAAGSGGETGRTIELQACRRNGEEFPVELALSALRLEDGWHAVGIIRDITERRRTEEERQKLEARLQRADKMESIGTLAGGIAHDFNNLLMGIQGYASLMLLDLDPSHPFYDKLERIEEHVKSGADLTGQLLGFAQGGRYEVKPADMNEVVKKTSSMFGRTRKEIIVNREYGKNLWIVEVDLGQMEQVLMNLYVNAWQAMPGGGELYLKTGNVVVGDVQAMHNEVEPGRYVMISVADTGVGMDEKTRERIFDPFFTTKDMGKGTGLGLAMVYGIIKGHRGFIEVRSEPGQGATFNLYLPATENEKELVKHETPAGRMARGTETILLVDDERSVLDVSKAMIGSLGYKVYTAGSGRDAIAFYMEKGDEIDLVILDMVMPGMSGGETFDALRKIDPDVRVMLSSGYSITGQAQEILDRGCKGFIQKPFRLEMLSNKVREILD